MIKHNSSIKGKPKFIYDKLDEKFKLYHQFHSAETGQKPILQQADSKTDENHMGEILKHFNSQHQDRSEPKNNSGLKINEKILPKKEIISRQSNASKKVDSIGELHHNSILDMFKNFSLKLQHQNGPQLLSSKKEEAPNKESDGNNKSGMTQCVNSRIPKGMRFLLY